MRISDWSSDVCSSDLRIVRFAVNRERQQACVALLKQASPMRLAKAGAERGKRRADAGVASKGDFLVWREDAQTITGIGRGRRQHECGFDQIGPGRETLHASVGPVFGAEHHPKRVAAAGALGKKDRKSTRLNSSH